MCLSIAIHRPNDVLGHGEHLGFEWMVVHNGVGYRCGYVRVPVGHPWHGKDYNDFDVSIHGGLTFAEPDLPCEKGGPDDAHWFGFDCGHGGDGRDPALPTELSKWFHSRFDGWHIWSQEEVEAECRELCRQAAEAAVVTMTIT